MDVHNSKGIHNIIFYKVKIPAQRLFNTKDTYSIHSTLLTIVVAEQVVWVCRPDYVICVVSV